MKDTAKIAQMLFETLAAARTEKEEQAVITAFIQSLKNTHAESYGTKVIDQLQVLLEKADNVLRPIVTTAVPLTDRQSRELAQQLKQQHNASEVLLDARIDPTVLGGISIKIDDILYDATLKKKLATLTNTLTQ